MSARRVACTFGLGALLAWWPAAIHSSAQAPAADGLMDLRQAVVVVSPQATPRERKAVQVLVEEVHKRTAITLPVQASSPTSGRPTISVAPIGTLPVSGPASSAAGLRTPGAEGFQIRARRHWRSHNVVVAGADERGILFGVGRLLRELRFRAARSADA